MERKGSVKFRLLDGDLAQGLLEDHSVGREVGECGDEFVSSSGLMMNVICCLMAI